MQSLVALVLVSLLVLHLCTSTAAFSSQAHSHFLISNQVQQPRQYGSTSCSSVPLVQEQQQQQAEQQQRQSQQQMVLSLEATSNSMIQKSMISSSSPFSSVSNKIDNDDADDDVDDDIMNAEYQRGLFTIGFITLLFASNSPVLHAAFQGANPPPVVLLNAAVSVIALVGLLLGGENLESNTPLPQVVQEQLKKQQQQQQQSKQEVSLSLPLWLQGGLELGLWKFLGTTANLYGLSMTSASHAAFLIQLTTLIVPVVQGIMGVAIPQRIQWSVVLALAGVACFALDPTGVVTSSAAAGLSSSSSVLWGDALCVVAAGFYATYDLRLFAWGKRVVPRQLITTKIGTQALLSVLLLLLIVGNQGGDGGNFLEWGNSLLDYLHPTSSTEAVAAASTNWMLVLPCVLWSGVAVNAVAPFLQVGGQQVVGPTRCQTIYASQPLWAALLSFFFLGETIGTQGLVGATAFLSALALAATTEAPDPNCPQSNCEV